MKRHFTHYLAPLLLSASSFGQIPITTINLADPTYPGTPGGAATGPTAPQPQLVPCSASTLNLNATKWAFFSAGGNGSTSIRQIGIFTIGDSQRGALSLTGNASTNLAGTMAQRMAPVTGLLDVLCLAGTNTIAAGTMQIGGGVGGQIFTWSYPITATIGVQRDITYAVTSNTSMNLSPYSALNPRSFTFGYGDAGKFFGQAGAARQIVGQLPCPADPNSILDSLAPNGYKTNGGPVTTGPSSADRPTIPPPVPGQLNFKTGTPYGTVSGNPFPNNNNGSPISNPQPVEAGSYEVYAGCTGFAMTIPFMDRGIFFGDNWEGVFASGDFSIAYILNENSFGFTVFTLTRN